MGVTSVAALAATMRRGHRHSAGHLDGTESLGLACYETNGPSTDALSAYAQAASDNIAKQLSISFGWEIFRVSWKLTNKYSKS